MTIRVYIGVYKAQCIAFELFCMKGVDKRSRIIVKYRPPALAIAWVGCCNRDIREGCQILCIH